MLLMLLKLLEEKQQLIAEKKDLIELIKKNKKMNFCTLTSSCSLFFTY
jgi:hypothetical protein